MHNRLADVLHIGVGRLRHLYLNVSEGACDPLQTGDCLVLLHPFRLEESKLSLELINARLLPLPLFSVFYRFDDRLTHLLELWSYNDLKRRSESSVERLPLAHVDREDGVSIHIDTLTDRQGSDDFLCLGLSPREHF